MVVSLLLTDRKEEWQEHLDQQKYCSVTVSPEGPLILQLNTSITINCTMAIGISYSHWTVIYNNATVIGLINDIVPGVSISINGLFSTSVLFNSNDEDIIGLACFGSSFEGQIGKRINITIGPLVVKTNSEVTINCSISEGSYSYWEILYIRKASVSRRVGTIAPGISVTTSGINMSSLVMNTSDTTIIGFVCYGSTFMAEVKARINVTIIGMLINPNLIQYSRKCNREYSKFHRGDIYKN